MSVWSILGIEPTKDPKELKRAYMEKLPLYNPEDDQEGFRRLREAYEEAVRLSAAEEPEEDNTPSGQVVRACIEIYQDFSRRVNPKAWQEILELDICQQIDLQQEIGEKLLIYFFMDHYRLPHPIWKLLNQFFCWEEQKEFLKEKFPANFIDFIITQSTYEDYLRYELFHLQAGLDYEQFITNYFALSDAVSDGDEETAERLFLETDQLGIAHLDYELLKLRYYLVSQKSDLAERLSDSLIREHPEDSRVQIPVAQCYLLAKRTEEALPLFIEVLKENPQHYSARLGLANCFYQQEDYAAAKEKYWEILFDFPYDGNAAVPFYDCNEKLIPVYEAKIAKNPNDQDSVYKLASCYHNCRRFAEGKALLDNITPEPAFAARHHDIYAYALMETGDTEGILEHLLQWEALEQNRLRVVRQLPSQLLELGQTEMALEKCEEYMQEFPEEAMLYDTKAQILKTQNELEQALFIVEQGLKVKNEQFSLHVLKTEILYEQGNYGAALESSANALNIYPHLVNMMFIQTKIYYQADNYDEVIRLCDQIDQYDIEDKKEIDLYRSLANLALAQEVERSLEFLDAVLAEEPSHPLALYAVKEYYEDRGDIEKARTYLDRAIPADPGHFYLRVDRARMFRIQRKLEEALADMLWLEQNNPHENPDFYNEKGLIYEAMERVAEARACYEKAIAADPYDRRAYGNIAGLYSKEEEYEKALEYYTKQLEIREHPYYYISRGLVYSNLKRTEEEKADYLRTIELDPKYAYAYNNMGVVMYEENDFAEALQYLDQALMLEPSILSAHQYKAKSLIALGEPKLALKALDEGIAYFESVGRKSIGQLYEEKLYLCREYRLYEEALALIDPIIKSGIGNAYIFRTIAYCAYEMYQDDLAGSYFDRALEADRQNVITYCEMAYFYIHGLKKPAQAIRACKKAIKIEPENIRGHLQLASAYKHSRDLVNALNHYWRALELLQKIPEGEMVPCDFRRIGDCYQNLGYPEKAEAYYWIALEGARTYCDCTPRFCYEGLYGLAKLYEDEGDLEKAQEYYGKTLEIQADREYVEGRAAFLAKGKRGKKGFFDFLRRKK